MQSISPPKLRRPSGFATVVLIIMAFIMLSTGANMTQKAVAGQTSQQRDDRIVLSGDEADPGRDLEIVLSHDDGTPEAEMSGFAGTKLAVRYQAPPNAIAVTGIEIYIMDDHMDNPYDPGAPSTAPFTVWVWRPAAGDIPGWPANSGYVPFVDFYEYPEDELVRVYLPQPIDITNPASFPDAEFYVGIEWEYRMNPYVGVDMDDPDAGCSYRWNWYDWEPVDGNVMIHAVVSAETLCVPHVIRVDAGGGGDYTTIQEGIDAAGLCDTVVVLPGIYTGPGNRGISFGGRNLVLRSEGGRAEAIIDCERQDRGFCFIDGESAEAVVRGFTVRNGSGSGGGIRCVNSCPTVVDCAFLDCDGGSYGGGVYLNNAVSASPLIANCVFAGNTSSLYGGGALLDFSDAAFENCTFVANGAPLGGAVACGTAACPTFSNCILAFSPDGAAAQCSATSAPDFTHCCVYGNAAGDSLCGTYQDNLFADPLFCDLQGGDYHVRENSPCLPDNNGWFELVGALDGACDPTAVETRSWGAIKAMFR
ncbi:MAG: hypothetical protein JXB46_06980 [Candidatus Eisenbacteria bacterium]|nr:hypothetical protein [Candidatus Eisenbacteria bacterium]